MRLSTNPSTSHSLNRHIPRTTLRRQGYQAESKVTPVSLAERCEWAQASLEEAVGRLRKARQHKEPEAVFVAAILSRFDDLECARESLKRASA